MLSNFDANFWTAAQGVMEVFPYILALTMTIAMFSWGLRKIASIVWTTPPEPRQPAEETTKAPWTTPREVQAQSTSTAADADLERLRRSVEKGSL